MRCWVLGLSLVACGGHTPSPAPLAHHVEPSSGPRLPGFGDADLVTFEGKQVVAYSVAGGKLAKLGALDVTDTEAEGPYSWLTGDWADRNHLFIKVGERDVVMIAPAGMSKVTVPDESNFKTPKPKADDQLVEGGTGGDALRVTDGSVWWVECPWGYPYDGFQCEEWVGEELWPEAGRPGADSVSPRSWSWTEAKPAGATAKEVDGKLACTSDAATTTFAGKEEPEQIDSFHWVTPTRLLVVYGEFGLADMIPTRWELHDGCAQAALAEGAAVAPGPDGLWVATGAGDNGKNVLRRGDRILGELPTNVVKFRPPR